MKVLTSKSVWYFILLIIFSSIVVLANVIQPIIVKNIIDLSMEYQNIKIYILLLLLSIVILLLAELSRKVFSAKYNLLITNSLREKLVEVFISKRINHFKEISLQEYISIFNNDLNAIISDYYLLLPNIIFELLSVILYSTALIFIHPTLAIIVISSNLFSLIIPYIFKEKLKIKRNNIMRSVGKYNIILGDIISGITLIQRHRLKKVMTNRATRASYENCMFELKFNYSQAFIEMVIGTISFMGSFALIVTGIILINREVITIGGLFAAIQLSELLISPVIGLTYDLNTFNSTSSIKENIVNIFFEKLKAREMKEFEEVKGNLLDSFKYLEFKNVSFKYEESGENILQDISLKFTKGMKVLFHGHNGSGKSTIIKLLGKEYDNYSGKILLDGIELRSISPNTYFRYVGIVPQKPFLFRDTLINNITLYKDYNDTEIDNMVNMLNLKELVTKFQYKIFSKDNENISGGEKEKIAIARVLLESPKVIIFDESMAEIDTISSQRIEKLLLEDKTQIFIHVAHKINSKLLNLYDQIVCFDDAGVKVLTTKNEKEEFLNVVCQ